MTARHFPAFIILILATLAPCATAQNVFEKPPPRIPTIDLEFRGGTVADYVAAIRRRSESANILVMPDATGVKVPPVQLKSVAIGDALGLLDGMVEESPGRSTKLDYDRHGGGPVGTSAIHVVSARVAGAPRRDVPKQNMVLAVDEILASDVAPEAILTAVETAMELLADQFEPARVRFHPDAGLLIARGHPEQISTIDAVVVSIRQNVDGRLRREHEAAERERALELSGAAHHQVEAAREQVEQSRNEVMEWRMRAETQEREIQTLRQRLEEQEQERMHLARMVQELEVRMAAIIDERK